MNVLDASVILKWHLKEEDSDKAIYLRTQFLNKTIDIAIPDLVIYEISNALRFKKNFQPQDIKLIVESLYKMKIKIFNPSIMLVNRAIDYSNYFDVTIYDSTYLSLAIDLNYTLITADEKFYKKIILKTRN